MLKKRSLIIATICLLAFFVSVNFVFAVNQTQTASNCGNLTSEEAADACFNEMAEANKDVSLCDKIKNVSLADGCYVSVAELLLDTTICEKIKGPHYYDCISAIAIKKQDVSLCSVITEPWLRDRCYSFTARDAETCLNIVNTEFKNNCYKNIIFTNGVCGSANGQSFTSKPTTNLCGAGTASIVSGSGPWTWFCYGSNGAATVNCSAKKTADATGSFKIKNVAVCKENSKPIIYYFGSASCSHCEWETAVLDSVVGSFGNYISYHKNIDNFNDQSVFLEYSDGSIPAIIIGCKYYRLGSGERIGVEAEKAVLKKKICEATGNMPTSICLSETSSTNGTTNTGTSASGNSTANNKVGSLTITKPLNQMTRDELIQVLIALVQILIQKQGL
ncbi:MAG: hypothetical protein WC520_00010 [Candidatus Paceibacterota bacterium]